MAVEGNENVTTTESQESNAAEEKISLTSSELQKLIDSKVTNAVKTRESNLESKYSELLKSIDADKEAEKRKSLEDANKLIDEYKGKAQKYELERATKAALKEIDALDVVDLFDHDISTVEGRKAFALAFKERLKSSVENEIKTKLNTSNTATTKKSPTVKNVSDMTTEEYKAYKKENNIF